MPHRSGFGRKGHLLGFNVLAILAGVFMMVAPTFAGLTAEDIAALQERAEREGWTFTFGENSATQYSLDQLCGLKVPENWPATARFDPCTPTGGLPLSFDWRELGGFTPVINQGGCGSCWAFGTVGALECAIKIIDGVTEDLSEQWVVSCNQDGWSCGGGWFAHDYHQWKTDPCGGTGAVLESDFPYQAQDLPCGCPYPHHYLIQSWAFIGDPFPSVPAMKQAIVDHGPISVCVYANDAMQGYNGGVFNACENDQGTNHIVCLVGWDDNQGTDGVWIMRNSWGGGWGEGGGYMRIEYGCSRIGEAACYVDYGPLPPIIVRDDFAIDDSQGDGNNRPDPGESNIQLIVTASNFGADALGLTMQAATAYPQIDFSNAESNVGDVPRWAQFSNSADPVVFAVHAGFPPTIVDFVLTFSANGGEYTHVETLMVDVGQPQFIIIDDDEADPYKYERYYTHFLDSLRTPHVVWGKDTLSSPPADTLADYPFTIWFTGDARSEVLSAEDVAHLKDFLDGGGRLFLTGQDIAEDLSDDADSTFLRDYLHVRFVPGSPIIAVEGVPGDPIGDGHWVPLGGTGGAANQSSPDILEPVDTLAKPIYTYYRSSDIAGVHVAVDDYRVVFFGFGSEAIANDLGYTTREQVFERVFNWLLGYTPGDLNLDREVNPLDVVLLVNYVYFSLNPPPIINTADVNTDCEVNPVDVTVFVNYVYLSRGRLLPGCVE